MKRNAELRRAQRETLRGGIPNNRHYSGSHDERADPRPDDGGLFHLDAADIVLALEVGPKLRLYASGETFDLEMK
jgi:hypothetical protein